MKWKVTISLHYFKILEARKDELEKLKNLIDKHFKWKCSGPDDGSGCSHVDGDCGNLKNGDCMFASPLITCEPEKIALELAEYFGYKDYLEMSM